jgi:hypothetical protein
VPFVAGCRVKVEEELALNITAWSECLIVPVNFEFPFARGPNHIIVESESQKFRPKFCKMRKGKKQRRE